MARFWGISTAIIAVMGLSGAASAQTSDLSRATEDLRSASEELRREESAYRASLQASKIKGTEQADYAEFIAHLRLRVFQGCESLRTLGGEDALQGFDCVRLSVHPVAGALAPAPLTDDEKRAALHARMDQLEDNIDESLLKRQQEIRRSAAQTSASGGGQAGGGGTAGGAGSSGSAGANVASAASSPQGGQSASERGGGTTSQVGSSSPASPAGPTDQRQVQRQTSNDGGIDDDIVARQLREAAEKESDPVLKDKLWTEYRKYKEAKR